MILLFCWCKFSYVQRLLWNDVWVNMNDHTHLAAQIIPIYQRHAKAWTDLRGQLLYEKTWLDRFLAYLPAQAKNIRFGLWFGASYCCISITAWASTYRGR